MRTLRHLLAVARETSATEQSLGRSRSAKAYADVGNILRWYLEVAGVSGLPVQNTLFPDD